MKAICKIIFSTFFGNLVKAIKWIVIGLIVFGMALAWPLQLLIKAIRGAKDDPYK